MHGSNLWMRFDQLYRDFVDGLITAEEYHEERLLLDYEHGAELRTRGLLSDEELKQKHQLLWSEMRRLDLPLGAPPSRELCEAGVGPRSAS